MQGLWWERGGHSSPASGTEGFYPSLSAGHFSLELYWQEGFLTLLWQLKEFASSEQKSREIVRVLLLVPMQESFSGLLFDSSLSGALYGKELVSADLFSEVPKDSKLPW